MAAGGGRVRCVPVPQAGDAAEEVGRVALGGDVSKEVRGLGGAQVTVGRPQHRAAQERQRQEAGRRELRLTTVCKEPGAVRISL